jgi:hypothetical protein
MDDLCKLVSTIMIERFAFTFIFDNWLPRAMAYKRFRDETKGVDPSKARNGRDSRAGQSDHSRGVCLSTLGRMRVLRAIASGARLRSFATARGACGVACRGGGPCGVFVPVFRHTGFAPDD